MLARRSRSEPPAERRYVGTNLAIIDDFEFLLSILGNLFSDFNILLTSTGMLHSPANLAAMEAGIPAICMDGGMTLEMFQSGAVTEDVAQMSERCHFVATSVFGVDAKTCRVTSRYGTDITYDVSGRIFIPPLKPPDFDHYKVFRETDEGREDAKLYYYLCPTGEFTVAPVEYSANGRLVFDLTMHHLGLYAVAQKSHSS